ncbi:expressed unknown protein [Seminavis robusta]|uniref:Mitochondrial carrier n=1 Tax=Seminavis robusta TaxID=568900 RepID=A0A9N8DAF3_9STRA|nr:expressed unknown protein [Seminavis robusta]|eukprot:Sro52_g031060.1 n/a (287) ;mRNA; f:89164-90024
MIPIPEEHHTTLITLRNTSLACLLGGLLSYPFDQWHYQWQHKSVAAYAADHDRLEYQKWKQNTRKQRFMVRPLMRLVLHEVSLEGVNQGHALYDGNNDQTTSVMMIPQEVSAGIVSGVTMALLLCPFETHRAMARAEQEKATSKWTQFRQATFDTGGMMTSTTQRLQRAYQGVGMLALREVAFNVTFFPLAASIRTQLLLLRQDHPYPKSSAVVASNVLAGSVCSLLVLPLDIARTYLWHSAERWNLWSGTRMVAPPLVLLTRGWTVQALVLGPAFGLVASIYDMT